MPADAFVAKLNEQIANEFAAHQQYVACAVYYDDETLPQLAALLLPRRRSRSATTR